MALQIGTASSHSDLYSKLRTFLQAGANAEQVLTVSANPADTETVVLNGKTYTFQTTLTNSDGNVQIGASAAISLANLVNAVNLGPGSGTAYAAATTTHATMRAVPSSATTVTVRALTPGTGGNALTTTETLSNGSFGAGTLANGGDGAWTQLRYNGTDSALFMAPGLSGTEEIHVGLGFVANVGTDSYALTGWMFRSYNAGLDDVSQPGHSGVGHLPVWDQAMPYWFIGNGQRVIVITKTSTVYTACYIGKFLPYGVPGEYPQPYYLGMCLNSNTRWSNIDQAFRCFWDPGTHAGSRLLRPDGQWYQLGNFQSGATEVVPGDTNNIWPYAASMANSVGVVTNAYRWLRNNVDGSYPQIPLTVCGSTPLNDIYGELDGAYATPGFSAASEDLILQGGEYHLLVQNVFRTERYHYATVTLK